MKRLSHSDRMVMDNVLAAAASQLSEVFGETIYIRYSRRRGGVDFEVEVLAMRVINSTAGFLGLSADDILGKSRLRDIVEARMICVALIRMALPDLSNKSIAKIMKKDRTTANNHYHDTHQELVKYHPPYKRKYEQCKEYVCSRLGIDPESRYQNP